uniref:Uncharacterized protein n=1 Tax=Marmota marmota marmota TaxID=9994 RepID=A0A8C6A8K1_MARMA
IYIYMLRIEPSQAGVLTGAFPLQTIPGGASPLAGAMVKRSEGWPAPSSTPAPAPRASSRKSLGSMPSGTRGKDASIHVPPTPVHPTCTKFCFMVGTENTEKRKMPSFSSSSSGSSRIPAQMRQDWTATSSTLGHHSRKAVHTH